MAGKNDLAAPCGLYCGVCGIYIATREDNAHFKEKLAHIYASKPEDLICDGCMSERVFTYCRICPIKSCVKEKKIEGCFECNDFPCPHIDNFPIPVGRKVILRSVPRWREVGTEQWISEEENRYNCPRCGRANIRGARRCQGCKEPLDLD